MIKETSGLIILMAVASPGYIPRKDDGFNNWQQQFVQYITAKLATFGISSTNPDWMALLNLQIKWTAKFVAGNKFADRTHSQTVDKQSQRVIYERALRLFNRRYIASNAAVTDADRAEMNTTIPDTVRTRPPVPKHAPMGYVRHIGHLFHELKIVDANTPATKSKPEGVRLTRVYMCIYNEANAPVDAHFEMAGDTSTYAYISKFQSGDVSKTAYYYLVYENTHGEIGPRSEIFSAVIA